MLKEKISKVERQMLEALAETRATFKHSGNKGTSNENSFGDFLRMYLPRRLEIGNGEIIDSFGNRSGQADIIIVSDDHPFTFSPNRPGLFFIEGVVSVGEIKTVLTSIEIDNTLKNSLLYKKLRTNLKGAMANANKSDLARYYEHPPFFLFCYESQLSLEKIKNKIEGYIHENSIGVNEVIDGVFILGKGWLINFGDGKGAFKYVTYEGKNTQGWAWAKSKSVLFDFFSFISVTMPRTIRFEPILKHYLFQNNK